MSICDGVKRSFARMGAYSKRWSLRRLSIVECATDGAAAEARQPREAAVRVEADTARAGEAAAVRVDAAHAAVDAAYADAEGVRRRRRPPSRQSMMSGQSVRGASVLLRLRLLLSRQGRQAIMLRRGRQTFVAVLRVRAIVLVGS